MGGRFFGGVGNAVHGAHDRYRPASQLPDAPRHRLSARRRSRGARCARSRAKAHLLYGARLRARDLEFGAGDPGLRGNGTWSRPRWPAAARRSDRDVRSRPGARVPAARRRTPDRGLGNQCGDGLERGHDLEAALAVGAGARRSRPGARGVSRALGAARGRREGARRAAGRARRARRLRPAGSRGRGQPLEALATPPRMGVGTRGCLLAVTPHGTGRPALSLRHERAASGSRWRGSRCAAGLAPSHCARGGPRSRRPVGLRRVAAAAGLDPTRPRRARLGGADSRHRHRVPGIVRRPQRVREPSVRGPAHARDARRGHRQPGLEREDPRRSPALPRRGRPRPGARVGALEPPVARDAASGGVPRRSKPPASRSSTASARPTTSHDPSRGRRSSSARSTALPSAARPSTATRRRRGAPSPVLPEAAGSWSA
jgi:hypothetical protein